jgi:hypothetical protein
MGRCEHCCFCFDTHDEERADTYRVFPAATKTQPTFKVRPICTHCIHAASASCATACCITETAFGGLGIHIKICPEIFILYNETEHCIKIYDEDSSLLVCNPAVDGRAVTAVTKDRAFETSVTTAQRHKITSQKTRTFRNTALETLYLTFLIFQSHGLCRSTLIPHRQHDLQNGNLILQLIKFCRLTL